MFANCFLISFSFVILPNGNNFFFLMGREGGNANMLCSNRHSLLIQPPLALRNTSHPKQFFLHFSPKKIQQEPMGQVSETISQQNSYRMCTIP